MPSPIKEKITDDLEKARQEGKLRASKIREIVQSALAETTVELRAGSKELRAITRDAIAAILENLKSGGGEVREEIRASIEAVIDTVTTQKRESIAQTQAEVKQLQAQLDTEEEELQSQIDHVLAEVEQVDAELEKETPEQASRVRAAIKSTVENLKDTEEAALMRKRYAQLQAQLAVLKANLAARYGERYEDVKQHLDEAQTWYQRTKAQGEVTGDRIHQKQTEFENKLSNAGTSVARKEQQVRQALRDLWHSVSELF